MATVPSSVQILGRSYLPGPGFNTSGSPKQGKTQTWGRFSGTYSAAVTIVPNDFGLTTIDHLTMSVITLDGADVAAGAIAGAQYRPAAGEVELYSDASTECVAQTYVVTFHAVGDSARDVESLS